MAFDADRAAWSRLNATNALIHRYRQSLVRDAETGVVYLFGGESYKPYMYHNAVDALRLPAALAAAAPAEAGAVGRAAPPQSLTAATPPPRAAAAARGAEAVAAAASLVTEPPKLWDRPAEMIGEHFGTARGTRRPPGRRLRAERDGRFPVQRVRGVGPRVLRAGGLDRMLLAPLLPFIAAERLGLAEPPPLPED